MYRKPEILITSNPPPLLVCAAFQHGDVYRNHRLWTAADINNAHPDSLQGAV
jgi:hypothetical protein